MSGPKNAERLDVLETRMRQLESDQKMIREGLAIVGTIFKSCGMTADGVATPEGEEDDEVVADEASGASYFDYRNDPESTDLHRRYRDALEEVKRVMGIDFMLRLDSLTGERLAAFDRPSVEERLAKVEGAALQPRRTS